MKISKCIAIAAMAVAASPCVAQEQTPENAQKFIAQIAQLGQINYADRFDDSSFDSFVVRDDSGPNTVMRTYPKQAYPLENVTSADKCMTKFTRTDTWFDWGTESVANFKDGGAVLWSQVTEVTQRGSTIDVVGSMGNGGHHYQRFLLPSETLATRVAFAMEVLRMSCDATGGTGF